MPDRSPAGGEGLLPPSGRQAVIANGAATAVVTEVGAGLRAFEIRGEPVLLGYGEDEMASGGKGQVLAPWPNRLGDGRYVFEGRAGEAALDEPERQNAIHGLLRWREWRLLGQSGESVRMEAEVTPQPGYPWRVAVAVEYSLSSPSCLDVTASARNLDGGQAPLGIGFHPYLAAGPGGVDACRLRLAASRHLRTDDRGLPLAWETPRPGGPYDLSAGASLDGRRLDDCFTGLSVAGGSEGVLPEAAWSAVLERGDGRSVTVSAGPELGYVMCYTADGLAGRERRSGVAVEPMSCPPNALVSGESLAVLEPAGTAGSSFEARWRVAAAF